MNLKRLLTSLLAVSILMALNTSCDNDRDAEEPSLPLQIEDLAQTYANNKLVINAQNSIDKQEVIVVIANDKDATLKLKNIVEGSPEIEFTTPLTQKENGAFSFNHIVKVSNNSLDSEIEFTGVFVGTIESSAALVLDYEVEHIQNFETISKEYKEEELFVNDQKSKKLTSATLALDKDGKGTITLHNITIGEAEHEVEIIVTKDDKNSFSFATTDAVNEDRRVQVSGTIINNVLSITHNYEVLSDVVGNWEMKITVNEKGERDAELFVSMSNRPVSIILTRLFVLQAIKALRPVLGDAVESVSLQFKKSGKLKIGYTEIKTPTDANSRIVKDEEVQIPIDIDYFVKGDVLHLAIPQELIEMGAIAIPSLPMEQIKNVLEKNGLHYTLPLHIEKKGDHTLFYIDEVLLVKLLTELEPIIETMIPEEGFTIVRYISSSSNAE